jgi:hypothetical protein
MNSGIALQQQQHYNVDTSHCPTSELRIERIGSGDLLNKYYFGMFQMQSV